MQGTTFGSFTLAFMGVFILLHGILLYSDQGTVSQYTFDSTSPIVKASTWEMLAKADLEKSSTCKKAFPIVNGSPDIVGYGISSHVNATDEKLFVKTTTSGIFVYLCSPKEMYGSTKKSKGDDDDDEDEDTGNKISQNLDHCQEYRYDAAKFKNHHMGLVNRLISCPIDFDGLMDCPKMIYSAGHNATAALRFAKCETSRINAKCTRLINFYTDGWPILGLVASSLYFVGGLLFVGGVNSGNQVRMAGAIIVLGTHVLILIGTIYRVTAGHAIHDGDGECIGSYLEDDLGARLEEQDSAFDDGIVFGQLVVTLLGAIFFAATVKFSNGNVLTGAPMAGAF